MSIDVKINDIPKNERPMERLIKFGADSLTNAELLAILLRTGTRGENIISISTRLLSQVDGLDGLLNISLDDIKKIRGIKTVKACQLMAMTELFKRFNTLRSQRQEYKITSPRDIADLLINEMNSLNQEVLKLILLNTKNIIIGVKDVFKGSLNTSIVHPREIFSEAVKKGSANIIICHNHPSGDPTPSKEDINLTIRIKQCGELMGIGLLDHIIIGNSKYISLKEKGII
jgi:DNA repair protein RadC